MAASKIEWTDETWNPTVGCTKISPGCKNCYAEIMHRRLTAMGVSKYQRPFHRPHVWQDHLELPLAWKQPRMVFVNSMSDLFHDAMPLDYIQRVFDVMLRCPQHTFQVLTKRAERLANVAGALPWPDNVWMGVSVETEAYIPRIRDLTSTNATVKFISAEPLLGPLPGLPLGGIHWVIVGGESGHKARPMDIAWARDIRDQCAHHDVAFFLKQLGGRRGKRGGAQATLDGRLWREYPNQEQGASI